MPTKYFYKVEHNTEFVWRLRTIKDDPYRKNDRIAELFVNNVKLRRNRLCSSEADLKHYGFLTGFKEISSEELIPDALILIDDVLGLLRKDERFALTYAYRNIKGLNCVAQVEFETNVGVKHIRKRFLTAINPDDTTVERIIQTCFETYKSRWDYDEYYSAPKLDTLEKFLPTIDLQTVSLEGEADNNSAIYYFRPSWDEEHGLYVDCDFTAGTCKKTY